MIQALSEQCVPRSEHRVDLQKSLIQFATIRSVFCIAQSEVDHLTVVGGEIIPIEARAGARGSMQSLYRFMQKHHSSYGVRTSMGNVSVYRNGDYEVHTIPLYALSYVGGYIK